MNQAVEGEALEMDSVARTPRSQAKAERRRQLLVAAARLIAERGFTGVRLEDLGAAVGISGPAVYRHFPNKDALLVEILVDISRRLFAGGTAVEESTSDPHETLEGLVDFHLDFALGEQDSSASRIANCTHSPRRAGARSAPCSAATSRSGWACCAASIRHSPNPTRAP